MKGITLYDIITSSVVDDENYIKGIDVKNLSQHKFGAIMHDESIDDNTKTQIAQMVESMGGYECLAQM